MIPACLNAARTFAGVSGAWRTRTPVASKIAFATAEPTAAVGGSPEPVSVQPWLNASVLPFETSVSRAPGTTTLYSPGWTLTSVTVGVSRKRRIGYETQSRVVTRSLFHATCSHITRERPWIAAPLIWLPTSCGPAVMPLFWAIVRCLTRTLPLFLLTWTSATMPTWLPANTPKPKPRPVTTSPLPRLEAATLGFHPAAMVAPSRTASQRAPAVVVGSTFFRRKATGSIFSAYASSSTTCSLAKYCCGALGARRKLHFRAPPYSGCVFALTRRGYRYAAV